MKRLQIYIDEDLDDALALEALKARTSKAALIREYVRDALGERPADPIDAFVGKFDVEPANVDDVVYPR